MKSLPWELCTVTMAQLAWVSYRLSLVTPSQGTVMGLHRAVWRLGSRVRGTNQAWSGANLQLWSMLSASLLQTPTLPAFFLS